MLTTWPCGKEIRCIFMVRKETWAAKTPPWFEGGGQKQGPWKSWSCGFQSGIPGTVASASPGNLIEMQILILNLLNQKLWRWGPENCVLISPPYDSDAGLNLRTSGLVEVEKTGA